ncbi:hypothetical protein IQ06DRAFT_15729 [Phaeosphaeriaceae sp. SRC1lsM3a]|nr:hypothetical protein IQ06DRAFT_15729 [Stagonospora sp. SRC1lsM3a]
MMWLTSREKRLNKIAQELITLVFFLHYFVQKLGLFYVSVEAYDQGQGVFEVTSTSRHLIYVAVLPFRPLETRQTILSHLICPTICCHKSVLLYSR